MRQNKGNSIVRFPIDGQDLLWLDAGEAALPSLGWSRATRHRRLSRLHHMGLSAGPPEHTPANHPFVRATRAALRERPDLTRHLASPAALALLASLPDLRPAFSTPSVSGVSRPTWTTALRRLQRAALILRPKDGARLNPGLPALAHLVATYRLLYHAPPPPHGEEPWRVVFQHGVETFWELPQASVPSDLQPAGLSSGIALLSPLRAARGVAYHGPRRLDDFDHLLMALAASHVLTSGPEARIAGLAAASLTERHLEDVRVWTRVSYYGLIEPWRAIVRAARSQKGPIWQSAERMRSEFGYREVIRFAGTIDE